MRVLLDECLPRRLTRDLRGHDVRTVPQAGWAGRENGELLLLASTRFDAFVTIDRNLASSSRRVRPRIAIVALAAASNRYADVAPLAAQILQALARCQPGDVIRVGPTTPRRRRRHG